MFIIRNKTNSIEFWSNKLGWVNVEDATCFDTRDGLNLPIDGEWLEIVEPMHLSVLKCVADNPLVSQIVDDFRAGRRCAAVDAMWSVPPHITAQVIFKLMDGDEADKQHAMSITNRLVERFMRWRDALTPA